MLESIHPSLLHLAFPSLHRNILGTNNTSAILARFFLTDT